MAKYFAVLRDDVLSRSRSRVLLEFKEPIVLDPAHAAFFRLTLRGGMTVGEILKTIDRAAFAKSEVPTESDVLDELAQQESFVVPIEYSGKNSYDWIAIDLSGQESQTQATIDAVTDSADGGRRGLLLCRECPGALPGHVDCVSLRGAWEDGLRSVRMFVQFVRTLIKALPRTNVYVEGLCDAVWCFDGLRGHDTAIRVRRADEAVLASGPVLLETDERSDSELYLDLLYWLRCDRRGSQLKHCAQQTTAAALVAWKVLCSAAAVMVDEDASESLWERRDATFRGRWMLFSRSAAGAFLGGLPRDAANLVQAGDSAASHRTVRLRRRGVATARPPLSLFACLHLLGDLLNCTPSIHAYRAQHPRDVIRLLVPDRPYARIIELSPDVDEVVYTGGYEEQDLIFGSSTELVRRMELFQRHEGFRHVFDVQRVSRMPETGEQMHMAEGYAAQLGVQLSSTRPVLDVSRAGDLASDQIPPRPFIVLSRHTVSGAAAGTTSKYTKRWAEHKWVALSEGIRDRTGATVVSIGTPAEPPLRATHILNRHDLSITDVAVLLREAAALVVVDNGIYHIGQAVGVPLVHLYPAWLPRHWVRCCSEVEHVELHCDLRRLRVDSVLEGLLSIARIKPGCGEESTAGH